MASQGHGRTLAFLILYIFSVSAILQSPIFLRVANAQVFSKSIELARQDSSAFALELSRQNLLHAEALYLNLKECVVAENRLRSELTQDLDFLGLNLVALDHRPFSIEQVLQRRVPIEVIPFRIMGIIAHRLDQIYSRHRVSCANNPGFKFGYGSAFFDPSYRGFLGLANNLRFLAAMRIAVPIFTRMTPQQLSAVYDFASRHLFPKFAAAYPFVSEPWFKPFVLSLMDHPALRIALKDVFSLSRSELRTGLTNVYAVVAPFRIRLSGQFDNNNTYPFVDYQAGRYFQQSAVLQCMAELGAALQPTDFSKLNLSTLAETHAELVQRYSSVCPRLEREKILALVSIEDRLGTWMMPLSLLKVMNQRWAHNHNLPAEGTQLEQTSLEIEQNFKQWRGVERFTYLQTQSLSRRSMNHYSAPRFIQSEMKTRFGPTFAGTNSFILLAGAGYQIFDASIKLGIQKMDMKTVVDDAIQDLDLWAQAIR